MRTLWSKLGDVVSAIEPITAASAAEPGQAALGIVRERTLTPGPVAPPFLVVPELPGIPPLEVGGLLGVPRGTPSLIAVLPRLLPRTAVTSIIPVVEVTGSGKPVRWPLPAASLAVEILSFLQPLLEHLLLLPLLFFLRPLGCSCFIFFPDLVLLLLDQVHQVLVEVLFWLLAGGLQPLRLLHLVLVRGVGDVGGVVGEARHRQPAGPTLVTAVPGEGGGQRPVNGAFRHGGSGSGSGQVLVLVPVCSALGSAFCCEAFRSRAGEESYSTLLGIPSPNSLSWSDQEVANLQFTLLQNKKKVQLEIILILLVRCAPSAGHEVARAGARRRVMRRTDGRTDGQTDGRTDAADARSTASS